MLVALFDVDGMKRVNDQAGHAAGDRLLRRVGALLSKAAASFGDGHAVRLGGDEFALRVLDGDAAEVESVAEKVVDAGTDEIRGTGLSAGVASSRDVVDFTPAPRAVFRLADAALYRAKRFGGCRLTRRPGRGQDPDGPFTRKLSLGGLLPQCQGVLEQPGARRTLQCLVDVAEQEAAALNAAAWWVSLAPAGADEISEVAGGIDRDPQHVPPLDLFPVRSFPLADFPATVEALAGSAFWVWSDDPQADPQEVALLSDFGYRANFVVGATGPHGHR